MADYGGYFSGVITGVHSQGTSNPTASIATFYAHMYLKVFLNLWVTDCPPWLTQYVLILVPLDLGTWYALNKYF